MELAELKTPNVPVYAIPKDQLHVLVTKKIMPELIALLGVDVSKNPLKVATVELMVTESANRLTPGEIQKAFLMYVKGQLPNLEPISGHLDTILFNKVINAYKTFANRPKQQGKVSLIEDEEIISAYNHFKVMNSLKLKHVGCFEHLLERGFFKRGDEISEKTGKPWQEWYTALTHNAKGRAIAHAIDNNWTEKERSDIANDIDVDTITKFIKLEALKVFFGKYKNEDKLRKALVRYNVR
ncbi:MAG: hypothetical protein AAF600_13035 [Bacteroidota bacterium]